jgi:hypothetical protein
MSLIPTVDLGRYIRPAKSWIDHTTTGPGVLMINTANEFRIGELSRIDALLDPKDKLTVQV